MVSKTAGSMLGAGTIIVSVFAAGAATIMSGGFSPATSSFSSSDAGSGAVTIAAGGGSMRSANVQATQQATSANSFADFDFGNGTVLPGKATLWVGNATFKPGTSSAFVPVHLDKPTPNTVIARITTVNGTGVSKAVSGTHYQTVDTVLIFRPGDPLVQTLEVPILGAAEGQQFIVKFREAPWGALQGQSTATVTANVAVDATPKSTGTFREARTFTPTGTLQFELLKDTHKRSVDGGWDRWATTLSHGRAQTGNAETGLYVDTATYPGIEGPVYWSSRGLVLHTQKFKTPIHYQGADYAYGASVLDGRNFLASQIGYGQYEWDARMPNRRGSWPAFWLISTSGWPPEIDVYEGFGYQNYWDFDRHVGQTIHVGANSTRYDQRGIVIQTEQAYGLSGYSQDFHKFALDIQRDYITWFVDGKETYQSVNPFKGFRFYPLMNVAVKTNGAYDDGSGDMTIRSFKVYSAP